jgi:hypothetical protein
MKIKFDAIIFFADCWVVMSNEKPTTTEPKSKGVKIAEKARAKANGFSDAKRGELLDQGLAIIYGGRSYAKANRSCS